MKEPLDHFNESDNHFIGNHFYYIASVRRRLFSFVIDNLLIVSFLIISISISMRIHDLYYLVEITVDKTDSSTFEDKPECSFVYYSEGFIFSCIFGYFFLIEYFTGKTLGKFIAGTKVIRKNGAKPHLLNILIRTFIRITPFCILFLFNKEKPLFLHDRISQTLIIKD